MDDKETLARMTGTARMDLESAPMPEKKNGLGWEGKSLVSMLEESEELYRTKGCCYGLDRLSRRDEDPMRFEKVFAKLRGALVSSRETAMHVSASPIVRNIGELCFALYTPEGDSIVLSTGIIVHVHTMSEAIKYMIRQDYETDPGIRPGDLFCNNDPDIGGVHAADVATIVPLFWEGELIGWAAGVTHQVDIGASAPGHDPVQTQNRFEDGYYLSCDKIGENDKVFKTHRLRSQKSVRTPMFWDLDEKARVAGCHMIREAVNRIIREEGIEYYKGFVREVIEEGRQIFKARVKERLIPGVYKAASFSELAYVETPLGRVERPRKDFMMNAPLEITITPEGGFRFSLEGASRFGDHPYNCSATAMQGGLWVLLSQVLFYDGRVNDGAYFAIENHFPAGSWANPTDPYAAYGAAWGTLIPCLTGLIRSLSRGLYGRGLREEVISGYGTTADVGQGHGRLAIGLDFPLATFDCSSVGLGAGAIRDGLDYGYAMWNPESDMGDVEVWESLELGFPWLGRSVKPDTAGFGKYRGATGWENLRMFFGIQDMFFYISRNDGLTFMGTGLMGGYPNANAYRFSLTESNFEEVVRDKKPYPLREGNPADSEVEALLSGTPQRYERGSTLGGAAHNGDVVLYNMAGSPGFGDPIERDPEAIKKDLEEEVYTAEAAVRVYGVVADYDESTRSWSLDLKATQDKREETRALRKKMSVPFSDFHERERQLVLQKEFIEPVAAMFRESLELSPQWAGEFKTFWDLPDDFQF